ncbi:MAG: ribosome-associated translation inhibitor RaiA [Chloroflexi bacterium]|nr:ribosome-associated translation inhibitor RaiA [Chloroflexota bacterium]
MPLVIKGKNVEVNDQLRSYVTKRLGKLDRYLDNILSAQVELSVEKTRSTETRQVVQVTVDANGTILRGEEKAADMYAAVDAVTDKMERQIKRYKERLYHRGKTAAGRSPALPTLAEAVMPKEAEVAEEEEEEGRIVRTKLIDLKPMSAEEAIEQMELLGHNFFVLLNAETNDINVVYKRLDGNYGLLVPARA